MKFDVKADRALIRARSSSVRYVRAHIEAPAAPPRDDRLPVTIAFVLDRSGSMSGGKLDLAKQAVLTAVRSLHSDDRFSVVVYDNVVDLLVPATAATKKAKAAAEEALQPVEARGTTDLGGGWLLGCEQVAASLQEGDVARCLLMTDGLANVGITDPDELVRHARELAARGVATTTFGVGSDFDEVLLHDMAQAGNGNFYFIESAAQIADFVASEVGEALEVVAQDVVLHVDAPAGARVTSLDGRPTSHDGGHTTVALGPLVSEQLLDTVVKVEFPQGTTGTESHLVLELGDREGALEAPAATLTFVYASHAENNAQARERDVDREVAHLYAARARAEAVEHNRRGAWKAAERVLRATARRIREYAGDDSEMLAMADRLEREVAQFAAYMPAMEIKRQYFSQSAAMLSKNDLGQSIRANRDPLDD
jgi:Ca-activated chloride channel homolog